jgi:hypothetical protein
MGKNSKATSAIRDKDLRSISKIAEAPNVGIPTYQGDSLTQAGQSIGKSIRQYRDDNLASNARMGGSAERTEGDFQAQRAGERDTGPYAPPDESSAGDVVQFGDAGEHLGIMGASMMGSGKFHKGEVKKGYKKMGKC